MRSLDANDVLALIGLALIGGGTAAIYWPASLIVVGVLLLAAGAVPRVPRRKRP